jgi:hypothetical protein
MDIVDAICESGDLKRKDFLVRIIEVLLVFRNNWDLSLMKI